MNKKSFDEIHRSFFYFNPSCRLRIGGVAGATERTGGVVALLNKHG
jgi:hypothetical protein